jgi:hypothetical protein
MMSNIPWNSLSPLLFCEALIALTHKLNRADCGYRVQKTEGKISHLLYMNDLILLVRDDDKLEKGIKIVKIIGTDINIKFVLKMCKHFIIM